MSQIPAPRSAAGHAPQGSAQVAVTQPVIAELAYTLEPAHAAAFDALARKPAKRSTSTSLWGRLGDGLLAGSLAGAALFAYDAYVTPLDETGVTIGIGAFLVVFTAGVLCGRRTRLKTAGVAPPDPLRLGQRVLRLDETGVLVATSDSVATYPWNVIKKLSETPQIVVLWTGQDTGVVIPRTAFASRTDIDGFLGGVRSIIAQAEVEATPIAQSVEQPSTPLIKQSVPVAPPSPPVVVAAEATVARLPPPNVQPRSSVPLPPPLRVTVHDMRRSGAT